MFIPNQDSRPVASQASGDFLTFLNENEEIRVPRIQRAYAQGRHDQRLVRENFLRDIFDALESGTRLDLNFVYGARSNGCYDILDGQQRLTTLFLLYWYCENAEPGSNVLQKLKRLNYETRPTSSDFIDDLISKKISLNGQRPSVAIRAMKWFSHAYGSDPTVVAMLGMLDAIHDTYLTRKSDAEAKGMKYAISGNLRLICFQSLPLDGYCRTDELYIKMNARGLPLTPFENFKADLADWLRRRPSGYFVEDVNLGGRIIKWWQRFLVKIDTSWTDYFWERSDDCKSADVKLSSRLFRVFIRYLYWHYLIVRSEMSEDALADDPVVIFLGSDKGDVAENQVETYLGFDKYQEVLEKDPNVLWFLEKFLDSLIANKITLEKFDALLINPYDGCKWSWVGEKKYFDSKRAITFFAAAAFFERQSIFEENKFKQWMRVVSNSVHNADRSKINAQIGLTRVLVKIAQTAGFTQDVYGVLSGIQGVNNRAVNEEILKSALISRQKGGTMVEWEREIISAEREPFFEGMIGFYIDSNLSLEQFKHRRDNAKRLFDANGIASAYREHHGLLRAMLAQIPAWNRGLKSLTISENSKTNRPYLKTILADEAVRSFFQELTSLSGNDEMMHKVTGAYTHPGGYELGEADDDGKAAEKKFHERLIGNEKLFDWMDKVESDKRKSLTIEKLYGHYMLNARYSWSARVVLDTDREDMARKLIDIGFSLAESEQQDALCKYGFFTDSNIGLFKMLNGYRFNVVFRTDHSVELSYPGRTTEWMKYGLSSSYPAIEGRIKEWIQEIEKPEKSED